MDSSRPRIVVIGAGIAGLTLAAALDPTRFDVTLVEAQPERTGGAALGLWPGARRALSGLGIDLDARADERVEIRALNGRRRFVLPAPPVAQVRRDDLLAALAAAVPPSVRRVTARIEHPASDPRVSDAALVVGADGVRSRVRGVVDARGAERRGTSWVTLRGIVPEGGEAVDAGRRSGGGAQGSNGLGGADLTSESVAYEYWGRGRLFGDASVVGGRYWFTAHRPSGIEPSGAFDDGWIEPLDVARVVGDARRAFVDAAAPVQERLEWAAAAAQSPGAGGILATRLWMTPPLRHYVRGRFAVIGDAAHAGLPNLARGASDAVVDAVTLAATLGAGRSLAEWQARRLPVTQIDRAAASAVMRVATSGVLG